MVAVLHLVEVPEQLRLGLLLLLFFLGLDLLPLVALDFHLLVNTVLVLCKLKVLRLLHLLVLAGIVSGQGLLSAKAELFFGQAKYLDVVPDLMGVRRLVEVDLQPLIHQGHLGGRMLVVNRVGKVDHTDVPD